MMFRRLLLIPVSVIASLFLVRGVLFLTTPTQAIATTSPDASFYPAYYGLPETVGAYQLMIVHTADNTACMQSGEYRIFVVDTSGKFFQDNANRVALYEILNASGITWNVEYGGGLVSTREEIIAQAEEWNAAMKNGCMRLGPPPDFEVLQNLR